MEQKGKFLTSAPQPELAKANINEFNTNHHCVKGIQVCQWD
jgi:hypothetical protein